MPPRITTLDPAAKEALRKTVRALRAELLDKLAAAARSEYRLDVAPDKAGLPEARRCKRERLDAWLDAQVASSSGGGAGKGKHAKHADAARQRAFDQAVKEAASTLLNRLVLVRILEHHGVLRPAVVTGSFKSPAYEQEFLHYAGPLAGDDTRGYAALLDVVFAERALDLPGLFGPVGLTPLFPIPAASLRAVVDALNDPALDSAWGDDTTLGWVYQYWNDPEREALDAKIAGGGKIEPHEIASKTQMFTERYMVEWLLQNSLGLSWLCICKRNGWTPRADSILVLLAERRRDFRVRREAGSVTPDALLPISPGLEHAWKYYVPQPIPQDAVDKAPASIRDLKLLDPACGSGHFLVIAFDLLAEMYREEAAHRGETWSDAEIAESILGNNLHGIDIDPRAIQIAAAGLWLKARLFAPEAQLSRLNLVAPGFRLGALPKDDPALVKLADELAALNVPKKLTQGLVNSLSGVDHLGSLLRVGDEIKKLVADTDAELGSLFAHQVDKQRAALEARIAAFLDAHATGEDLGLRLGGEQLAAGLRFVSLVREGTYDVVVGNPPYQGLSKTAKFDYVVKQYPRGKADLYAAFLERGLELVREGGISALLTMRGWMFLGQFAALREHLLREFDLRALVDLDSGAFEEVSAAQVVLSVACSIFRRSTPDESAVALRPTPVEDRASTGMTERKRAGLLAQVGRYEFDPKGFEVIDGEPIVYWWTKEFLERYAKAPKLGASHTVRYGLSTQNNTRWLRRPWEVSYVQTMLKGFDEPPGWDGKPWVAYIKGSEGRSWCDEVSDVLLWRDKGLELATYPENRFGRGTTWYYRRGVAFANIGARFSARAHSRQSIFGHVAGSVFCEDIGNMVCLLNSQQACRIMESLNPGIHFLTTDVERLPLLKIEAADEIFAIVERAFTEHESHREPSVEFKQPGPSPWRYAQDWAQRAVDRPEGEPLPPYEPELDPPDPEAHLSFALGVALGRFGKHGEGILDHAPAEALPAGILFLGPSDAVPDSLAHPACAPLIAAWTDHPIPGSGKKPTLRDYLRKDFFAYHKPLYENRPIYFPLSSEKKSFVAWVSIHRWADNTLQILLADHLYPVLRQLDGEIADLNQSRASSDKQTAARAEKRYATTKRLRDELAAFIADVTQCAERGAPPTDKACPPREADAPFKIDLDDGVMINSAALWPLLTPQWPDPKKWWKQLCQAEGRKDYDWSHLARRYFPSRVDQKCQIDPSLAVAHHCFWKHHPAKAYAWELRLKHELRPDFTIDEPGSDKARERYLADKPDEAAAIREKEEARRERASSKSAAIGSGDNKASGRSRT